MEDKTVVGGCDPFCLTVRSRPWLGERNAHSSAGQHQFEVVRINFDCGPLVD